MHGKMTTLALATLLAASVLLTLAAEPGKDDATAPLLRRRDELQLQLLKERAALLRKDPDLAELNQRIQRLYRTLDEELSKRPSVQKLDAEIKALDKRLQDRGGTGEKAK